MNKSVNAALVACILCFAATSKVFAGIPVAPVVLTEVQKKFVIEACSTAKFGDESKEGIEKLLAQGAVVDGAYPDDTGFKPFMMTCLMQAALKGNVGLARYLLEEKKAKALLKTKSDGHGAVAGFTPADQIANYFDSEAGWRGEPEVVKKTMQLTELLLASVIVEADAIRFPLSEPIGAGGEHPVAMAAEFGAENALKILLDRKLDPDTTGRGGLRAASLASFRGQLNSLKMLVAAGAMLGCDDSGCPIVEASQMKHESVVRYLIDQHVDVNAVTNEITALFAATESGVCPLSLLQALIAAGANPNFIWHEKLSDGRELSRVTALINVIKNSDFENMSDRTALVRALLEGGANPNLGDKYEKKALTLAKVWQENDIVELLLKYGADPKPESFQSL